MQLAADIKKYAGRRVFEACKQTQSLHLDEVKNLQKVKQHIFTFIELMRKKPEVLSWNPIKTLLQLGNDGNEHTINHSSFIYGVYPTTVKSHSGLTYLSIAKLRLLLISGDNFHSMTIGEISWWYHRAVAGTNFAT